MGSVAAAVAHCHGQCSAKLCHGLACTCMAKPGFVCFACVMFADRVGVWAGTGPQKRASCALPCNHPKQPSARYPKSSVSCPTSLCSLFQRVHFRERVQKVDSLQRRSDGNAFDDRRCSIRQHQSTIAAPQHRSMTEHRRRSITPVVPAPLIHCQRLSMSDDQKTR